MSGSRDDFTASTKRKLAERVACKCSNPQCKVSTIGPAGDRSKSANIGVAAHICAAAPGGPRYRAKMTSEERKDILNGIWLCQSCSRLIDVDVATYTEALLRDWKNAAEECAKENLGKQLEPSHIVSSFAKYSDALTHQKTISSAFRAMAREKLAGHGYILQTENKPAFELSGGPQYDGGVYFHWMFENPSESVMLFDLPGGVLENRLSIICEKNGHILLKIHDQLGKQRLLRSKRFKCGEHIFGTVFWSKQHCQLWLNEQNIGTIPIEHSIEHFGNEAFIGIDIESHLSADNIIPQYILNNQIGSGFQKNKALNIGALLYLLPFALKIDFETQEDVLTFAKQEAEHHLYQNDDTEITLDILRNQLRILKEIIEDDSVESLLQAASILRDLLCREQPNLKQLASDSRVDPVKVYGDILSEFAELRIPKEGFLIASREPLRMPPEMASIEEKTEMMSGFDYMVPSINVRGPIELYSINEFIELEIAKIQYKWHTCKEIIQFVAMLDEKVFSRNQPDDAELEMLQSNIHRIGGVPFTFRCVLSIARVVVESLEPFVECFET